MNVVVTGASRGIGLAVAKLFVHHGHHVIITSRDDNNLQQAVMELQAINSNVKIIAKAYNLADKEQAIAFAGWAAASLPVDILVNNAGTFLPGNISDEADDALESQLQTNLLSAYYITRTLLPFLKQSKQAHIFNMCSIASLQAYANGGAYSISKYALHGFNSNLREELKPLGIKVTGVYPGAVYTDSWGDFDNTENRIMEAADIASLVYHATKLSPAACVENITVRPVLGDL